LKTTNGRKSEAKGYENEKVEDSDKGKHWWTGMTYSGGPARLGQ